MNKWKKLGMVYAGCGMMMMCDPRNIDESWQCNGDPIVATVYKDPITGMRYARNVGKAPAYVDYVFDNWDDPTPGNKGEEVRDVCDRNGWEIEHDGEPSKFSYAGCVDASTNTPGGFNQIEGNLAVVASVGQGCFPVLGLFDEAGKLLQTVVDYTVDDYDGDMTAEEVIVESQLDY